MDDILSKRCILVTGKGGVGRSCTTAAIARVAQRLGKPVLVAEIGDEGNDYSPLASHFQLARLPSEIAEVSPGVSAVTLLPRTGQELFLGSVFHTRALARAALGSETVRRLLNAGPSFREMGVFFQLLCALRARREGGAPLYELIVVDMPATGHTLSLTGLPDQLLKLVPRGPIADALHEGRSYLNDPRLSAAWVVTLPETLPISECLELIEGLAATGMPAGGVVLNRIPVDPFTAAEREALRAVLARHRLYGADGFARAELARRESERLRAGTTLPIIVLPELAVSHREIAVALADALVENRRMPRAGRAAS